MSDRIVRKELRHNYQGENLVRNVVVELEDLGPKHETGMRWELRIVHPAIAKTSRGQESKQAPEVFRFLDEKTANAHADLYTSILDNASEVDPDLN